ncbi:MAG TPA: HEAT repeat domain-containing protein [Nitrospirota bacterium]|nr:HEAT repeat domain-containing protein [Nitrospirota bacterium]
MRHIALAVLMLAFAAAASAETPGPELVPVATGLMESMVDADPAVRQAVARRLGESRDKGALGPLSAMLAEDPEEDVRLAAMGALISIDRASSRPAFVKALMDVSERVRRSAAEALTGIWDEEAQKALIGALIGDISPKVRRSAAEALGEQGVMGKYTAHRWDSAAETEDALIESLKKDESYEVRAAAASLLGRFKSGKALAPLLDALTGDKSSAVRAAAAESLGMAENFQAVDRLIDALYFEKDEMVLVSALKSLKYSDDPRAAVPALNALKSGSPRVRWQAIEVLVTLRPPEAAGQLRRVAEDKSESAGIREKAMEALQLLGAE